MKKALFGMVMCLMILPLAVGLSACTNKENDDTRSVTFEYVNKPVGTNVILYVNGAFLQGDGSGVYADIAKGADVYFLVTGTQPSGVMINGAVGALAGGSSNRYNIGPLTANATVILSWTSAS